MFDLTFTGTLKVKTSDDCQICSLHHCLFFLDECFGSHPQALTCQRQNFSSSNF